VAQWHTALSERVAAIRDEFSGEFGVYVKHLDTGVEVRFDAEDRWYLASTVKVPVAIATLERVEAGDLSLERQVELRESHFVDGAGDLKWARPGDVFSVRQLLEQSIEHSDSMATDLLIGLVGAEVLDERVATWTGGGFGPLTTILQVRYDAYGVLDPRVANLPSRTFLDMRAAGDGEARLRHLAQRLGRARSELLVDDLEDLFESYYARGKNSARLDAYGRLLERLVRGELLSPSSTDRLLSHMQRITTGARRIAAGLPENTPFAQKTGTQIARSCNVGVAHPKDPAKRVVLVACAARYGSLGEAERAFQRLGSALGDVGFSPQAQLSSGASP
jgi:beta-lactamase class A